jgi:hypothetical protein
MFLMCNIALKIISNVNCSLLIIEMFGIGGDYVFFDPSFRLV